eukprot:11162016-Alexandrium_andersonii.AAC.1
MPGKASSCTHARANAADDLGKPRRSAVARLTQAQTHTHTAKHHGPQARPSRNDICGSRRG